jgi:hypothetical protein
MNPDELRRAIAGASPELKDELAQVLATMVSNGNAQVFSSAIEISCTWDMDGTDFVLALASLTDAQRTDAWHAACDRAVTEEVAPTLPAGMQDGDVQPDIIEQTFNMLGVKRTIYGLRHPDGTTVWPGVCGGTIIESPDAPAPQPPAE